MYKNTVKIHMGIQDHRKGSQLEGPLLGRAVSVGGTIKRKGRQLVGPLIGRAVSWWDL